MAGRGPTLKGVRNVRHDASNAGSRSPLRPSDAVLESEDGGIHLRPAQQDPHRQPRKDDAAVPGRDEVHSPAGREQGDDPVRGHQASGARHRRRGSPPLQHALRRRPLARRHAHQLQDRQGVDQALEGPRADAAGRHAREAQQARSADAAARDGQAQQEPRRDQGNERPAGRACSSSTSAITRSRSPKR